MISIPRYKRLLSYLLPVTIEKTIGQKMTILMVQIYLGELLLVTPDAIYSYGKRYKPFRNTFAHIQSDLPFVRSFLLLGTGLGSALTLLQTKYNCFPESTLVDYDEDVLKLSIKYGNLNEKKNVSWVCADATQFLMKNNRQYDLLGVDLFRELTLPDFVTSADFIALCRKALTEKGICIFNLIFKDDNEILAVERKLQNHFSSVRFLPDKVNTYFICHA